MRQKIVTEAFRYSDGEVGEERDKQEGRGERRGNRGEQGRKNKARRGISRSE